MVDADAAPPMRRWLSPLGEVLFTLYRVVWISLFGAGLVSLGYLGPRDEVAFQSAYVAGSAVGFWVFTNVSQEGQIGSPLGEEGQRIGFRSTDLLMMVDGQVMPTDRSAQARLLAGPAGSVAVLGMRHNDGTRFTVRVARDPGRLTRALAGSGIDFAVKRWIQFGFYFATSVGVGGLQHYCSSGGHATPSPNSSPFRSCSIARTLAHFSA